MTQRSFTPAQQSPGHGVCRGTGPSSRPRCGHPHLEGERALAPLGR